MKKPPGNCWRKTPPETADAAEASACAPRTGLARALSKLGHCSRSQGAALIRAGRVRVNGRIRRDTDLPIRLGEDRIDVDGAAMAAASRVYVMLNKPRGLVTTREDEQGRATVFSCLEGAGLPHLSPVGRLDKASEGMLLFSNDTAWAAAITDPAAHLDKTYHVQVGGRVTALDLTAMRQGAADAGEHLTAKKIRLLRSGEKNTWLEVILDEGRNRHIRRLLAAFDREVLRLVRVAIGPLSLGDLPKGQWRELTQPEIKQLLVR